MLSWRRGWFESRNLQIHMAVLRVTSIFCCAQGPRQGRTFILCGKRHKGKLERTTKSRAHGSITAAAAGLHGRDDTATEPVGAGALDGRKWSYEAQNGHAGSQTVRLDGLNTKSDPSDQNYTMR